MQGNARIPYTFIVPGTLSGNQVIQLPIPFNCTLQKIMAHGSNANDATLQVGTVADSDGIMTATAIGDSKAPATFDRDDWNGALYTDTNNVDYLHLTTSDVLEITVDYDGSSGTAVHDLVVLILLDEG